MNTLTLSQLREDLEALASAHPASYPTNVIALSVECGEVLAEFPTDEEDQLREELKNADLAHTILRTSQRIGHSPTRPPFDGATPLCINCDAPLPEVRESNVCHLCRKGGEA